MPAVLCVSPAGVWEDPVPDIPVPAEEPAEGGPGLAARGPGAAQAEPKPHLQGPTRGLPEAEAPGAA